MDVLKAPTKLEIRKQFVDMIRRELLGPAGGSEEIVTEPYVRDRYAVGLLAPRNAAQVPDPEDEQGPLATDQSRHSGRGLCRAGIARFWRGGNRRKLDQKKHDPVVNRPDLRSQSRGRCASKITVRWGSYLRCKDEEADEPTMYWQRIPIEEWTLSYQ